MIDRRKLIVALGAGALTAPLTTLAQRPPQKVPRIAFLAINLKTAKASRSLI